MIEKNQKLITKRFKKRINGVWYQLCACGKCDKYFPSHKLHGKEVIFISGHNSYLQKTGKNNPFYIDGRSKKRKKWKTHVLKTDNYSCRKCGKTKEKNGKRVSIYRIKSKEKFPELEYDKDNGMVLCSSCFMKTYRSGKNNPFYGKRHTQEFLNKKKSMELKRWKNPKYRKKQLQSILSGSNKSPNKLETKLLIILNKLYPNEWKFVGNGKVIIAGKCPDFINVNGQKKIIELFGDYWHKNKDPENRKKTFKPFGYDTLVIWEKELKHNMDLTEFKIHKFMRA